MAITGMYEMRTAHYFFRPIQNQIKPEDLPEWYLYGRYYKRFRLYVHKGHHGHSVHSEPIQQSLFEG